MILDTDKRYVTFDPNEVELDCACTDEHCSYAEVIPLMRWIQDGPMACPDCDTDMGVVRVGVLKSSELLERISR